MTKNEDTLIKYWIKYHGDIFGYENLYIIDASDDLNILNFYNSIKHTNINIIYDNVNLNDMEYTINNIMKSLINNCDFLIKLDTDEFIGLYNPLFNDISINKYIIRNYFDNLIINGLKYKASYTINNMPSDINDDPIHNISFTNPS